MGTAAATARFEFCAGAAAVGAAAGAGAAAGT